MNLANKLWMFEVKTDGEGGVLSGVREGKLKKFVKKCNSKAELTDANAEEWVLRYVIEEQGYTRSKLIRVEVKKIG